MGWFQGIRKGKRVDVPDGLWTKCENCDEILYNKEIDSNLKVCSKCQYHFRMTAWERINLLTEANSFVEIKNPYTLSDPLEFPEYKDKHKKAVEKTGMTEAVITGEGMIGKYRTALGVTDCNFMMGSMGSILGELVTDLVETATEKMLPLVIVSSSGGGARMQEGMLSLMQMAKVSAALAYYKAKGLPYISVLTDPTGGGVAASFAMLGDVILAEPNALICFAGPRVIEQTMHQKLPKGFQKSEFLLEHGIIDKVVHRKELKSVIEKLFDCFCYRKIGNGSTTG